MIRGHLLSGLVLLLLAPAGICAASEPERPVRAIILGATGDGPSAYVGENVQFMDTSQGDPTSWSWDFSYDGVSPVVDSAEQNPLWSFATAGTYGIRLEACNSGGCSSAVKQILVTELCAATHDLVLTDQTVNDAQQFDACQTITASTGFAVVDPGAVVFRAGRSIALGNGFSIGSGASFQAVIDPILDTP